MIEILKIQFSFLVIMMVGVANAQDSLRRKLNDSIKVNLTNTDSLNILNKKLD